MPWLEERVGLKAVAVDRDDQHNELEHMADSQVLEDSAVLDTVGDASLAVADGEAAEDEGEVVQHK